LEKKEKFFVEKFFSSTFFFSLKTDSPLVGMCGGIYSCST
jgi:hypothetical protein